LRSFFPTSSRELKRRVPFVGNVTVRYPAASLFSRVRPGFQGVVFFFHAQLPLAGGGRSLYLYQLVLVFGPPARLEKHKDSCFATRALESRVYPVFSCTLSFGLAFSCVFPRETGLLDPVRVLLSVERISSVPHVPKTFLGERFPVLLQAEALHFSYEIFRFPVRLLRPVSPHSDFTAIPRRSFSPHLFPGCEVSAKDTPSFPLLGPCSSGSVSSFFCRLSQLPRP